MRSLGISAAVLALLASSVWARLPASYSANDHKMVIAIKDQGDLGTCWAFSSSTVFEYSLLKAKLLTSQRASNLVSEWDMATHAGTQLSLLAPYSGWGSDPQNAIGYLTRGFGRWNVKGISELAGSGPVARGADPFNGYPLAAAEAGLDLHAFLPPVSQPTLPYRLVQAAEFVSESGGGLPPTPKYRDRIKQAILDYGALDTNMNAFDLQNGINKTFDTYAYTGPSLSTDHDVTIIGWNDDVPVYDKKGKLLGVGAWLIQNSWGLTFGNSPSAVAKSIGCFWLGYMDTAAVKYSVGFVTDLRRAVSHTILQNQVFGYDAQAGSPKGTPTYAAARLTPQSDTDLLALGLWTLDDRTVVDIDFFRGWGTQGPLGAPLATLHDVMIPQRGYNEIPLAAPVPLVAGRALYAVIGFGARQKSPIAVDTQSLRTQGVATFAGLSWESSNGLYWGDLSQRKTNRGIFFLKGIQGGAIVPHKGAILSITGLRFPLITTHRYFTLRGTASNNTRHILYRLGKTGPIVRARGRTSWKISILNLRFGRNVVQIWPTAAKGVATAPLRITILRRD